MTSVVYCRTFLHFMSSLFNNFKKTNSVNVLTPKVGALNIEFALKLIGILKLLEIRIEIESRLCCIYVRRRRLYIYKFTKYNQNTFTN